MYLTLSLAGTPVVISKSPVVDCLCFFSSLSPALSLSFPVHPPINYTRFACNGGWLDRQGATTKMCLPKKKMRGGSRESPATFWHLPKTILIWRLCFMLVVLRLASLTLQGPSGMQSGPNLLIFSFSSGASPAHNAGRWVLPANSSHERS